MGPGSINEIIIILSIDGGHKQDFYIIRRGSGFSILIIDNNIFKLDLTHRIVEDSPVVDSPGYLGLINS